MDLSSLHVQLQPRRALHDQVEVVNVSKTRPTVETLPESRLVCRAHVSGGMCIERACQDDLTTTLVQQCQQCQYTIQRIIEAGGDNEAVLFEALNMNDELQKVISKFEEMKKPLVVQSEPEPAMIPVAMEPEESPRFSKEDVLVRKPAGSRARTVEDDDMMHDLDEMIFGKKGGSTSEDQDLKKQQKDDMIDF